MNRWEMMQENLMVSLRLTEEGVSLSRFAKRYGVELREVFPHQLERTSREGLIEYDEEKDRLRLTYRGRLFGNRVFSQFVSNKVPKGYEHLLAQ
jgi:coproporphyrinogen III oxidase-like Fe-S oxidoreductase